MEALLDWIFSNVQGFETYPIALCVEFFLGFFKKRWGNVCKIVDRVPRYSGLLFVISTRVSNIGFVAPPVPALISSIRIPGFL